jgi:hypothetical protein
MDDKPLTLRKMIIDGKPIDDDFEVFWDGLPVGRILRQPGVPIGKPNIFWGVSFAGRPQPVGQRGIVATIDEAKIRFKLAWTAVRPTITEQDIRRERERLSRPIKKGWGSL